MIDIKNKEMCTGCGACYNICPKHAISMQEDEEGFRYPFVDHSVCIDCGLCEKKCPMLISYGQLAHTDSDDYPLFYAGQLLKKSDLNSVSSGGAFWAFAQLFIKRGGVVYGAVQLDVDHVTHTRAESLQEVLAMRRSKYLQSETKEIYRLVQNDLVAGRQVLFTGTGCQVAALKSYLAKDYEHLYTCDVVCHGVPSAKVWRKYREEKEQKEGKTIANVVFRDKSAGWRKNQYCITYDDGSQEKELSFNHPFHAGYLDGLFYRPSCGTCHFSRIPRVSDITLADFWKYEGPLNDSSLGSGVSLVVVNSERGQDLINSASDYLCIETTSREQALNSCRHLANTPHENNKRALFFHHFKEKGYFSAASMLIPRLKKDKGLKRIVKRFVKFLIK